MKKLVLVLILAIFVSVSIAEPVFADVIWEPEDNFYIEHQEECEYINRSYVAAGTDNVANLYKSPENSVIVKEVPNGNEFYVSWQWKDWLYYDTGWIHSDDLSLIYDSKSFMEDHETTDYTGEEYSIPVVQMYTYPNSGDSYEMIENVDYSPIGGSFKHVFVDDAGLQWGYIGYYMKDEGWVCIDDPTNATFDNGMVPLAESVSQKRGSDAKVEKANDILPVATVLVLVVVAVTLFLLTQKKKV